MHKKSIGYASPVVIITVCSVSAVFLHRLMGKWVFIPTFILYWGLSFITVFTVAGIARIKNWLTKPHGNVGWLLLSVIVGFIPVSILLRNVSIITVPLMLLHIVFSVINPFFEELYWRGFVIDFTFPSKKLSSVYSSVLFIVSHLFIWGVFSYGNRNLYLITSLTIMSVVWCIVRQKTKSIWWCIVSHFFVDLFNLLVFVMLNLYIPEQGYIPQMELLFGTLSKN